MVILSEDRLTKFTSNKHILNYHICCCLINLSRERQRGIDHTDKLLQHGVAGMTDGNK